MSGRFLLALGCAALLAGALAVAAHDEVSDDTSFVPIDHPAIQYFQAPVSDRIARLDEQLADGKVKLEFRTDGTGYLPSLLKNLGVNADSQMLVFSKTSFQAAKISPRAPRALYFSDDITVGFVRDGDVYEFTALDPRQGVVFYTFDAHRSDQPRFARRDVCLQCHQGPATLGVPGIMVASVYPDSSGMPVRRLGMPVTDHRVPFQDRWGGWYVSGTHGGMRHKGNAVARDPRSPDLLETQGTQNLTSLARKFDPAGYLAPVSDIVALMTLEHQTRMTNLMTRVAWEVRVAQHDGKLDDPAARARIDKDLESLVAYMLFADEAPLLDTIQGVSTFAATFAQRGPRDRQGRSLRDFDLEKRLFRYPLSYMVYSQAFDALPDLVRERVYQRVYDVLAGKDQDKKFARLAAEDRRAAFEILRETKPNLPAYWRETNR
jgi:hypothetical protein